MKLKPDMLLNHGDDLDLVILGGNLTVLFARRVRVRVRVGLGLGLGSEFVSSMVRVRVGVYLKF